MTTASDHIDEKGLIMMEGRMASLENNLSGLNASVVSLIETMKTVTAKMDKFDIALQAIVRIEERASASKAALERVFEKFEKIDSDMKSHEAHDEHFHDREAARIDEIEIRLAKSEGFLNPYITYGIASTTFPKVVSEGRIELTADSHNFFGLLGALAERSLTGAAATERLRDFLLEVTPDAGELIKRVILKDLRAGFTANTVNKVVPDLIPTFGCMLAHPYEEKRVKTFPVNVEPKLDGWRTLAFVSKNDARFLSRSGREYTTLDHIKPHLIALAKRYEWNGTMVLESEVMSGAFDKTSSELRRKDEQATDAKLFIFDVLPESVFAGKSYTVPFSDRRNLLVGIAKGFDSDGPLKLLPSYMAESHAEVMEYYGKFRARGLEGAIVKNRAGIYEPKRSHAWMKIKPEETLDAPILRAFEGEGKYAGMLGGFWIDVEGVEVSVGGGFSDDQRREFWEVWLEDEKKLATGQVMTLPGKMIEVEYHEKTPDGSLRHPRFLRFREDKEAA